MAIQAKTFYQQIYGFTKQIPRGKVTTYKELAHALSSKAYRAVGSAMRCNENAPIVPCHRVIKSNGDVGNYSAAGSIKKKIEMLRKEGVEVVDGKVDLKKYLHKFTY
ncbi:MGMT family protein [Candidatus Woesearchaeota archaeon]|nr:MGMT family protein [Candidatus Woesearchaeota archaeon]